MESSSAAVEEESKETVLKFITPENNMYDFSYGDATLQLKEEQPFEIIDVKEEPLTTDYEDEDNHQLPDKYKQESDYLADVKIKQESFNDSVENFAIKQEVVYVTMGDSATMISEEGSADQHVYQDVAEEFGEVNSSDANPLSTLSSETETAVNKKSGNTSSCYDEVTRHSAETSRCPVIKHKCVKCNQLFLTRDNLLRHKRYNMQCSDVSNTDKENVCRICGRSFSQSSDLVLHYSEGHNREKVVCYGKKDDKRKKIVCYGKKERNRMFSLRQSGTLISDKLYTCHICEKRFPRSCELVDHHSEDHKDNNMHESDEEDCTNESDEEGCTNKSTPEAENTLMGEMKYKCQMCERSFFQNHDLVLHYSETHNRNNICSDNEECTNELTLKSMKTLLEIKYKCHICGRRFSQNSDLGLHYRESHNRNHIHCSDDEEQSGMLLTGKQYTCHLCDSSFSRSSDLVLHHDKDHKKNSIPSVDLHWPDPPTRPYLHRKIKCKNP